MKVVSVGYCTEQGLGVLLREFYRNGVVTHVCLVRHASRPNYTSWYPVESPYGSPRDPSWNLAVRRVLEDADVALFFETPFDWGLIPWCRGRGVKTVLMPMYECMPTELPYVPDLILNPSDLDQRYFPSGRRVTVPVYASSWVARTAPITTFVHNAGHGGLRGRNGTTELVEGWARVSPKTQLILHTQQPLDEPLARRMAAFGNVDYRVGTVPREQLYARGDVFLFPEKFNGLSLPLQEAYSAGMVVCATRRFPNTMWLPNEPLIPTSGSRRARVSRRTVEFDEAVVDPVKIAATVDKLFGTDPTELSLRGKAWAEENDWSVWAPRYTDILREACGK